MEKYTKNPALQIKTGKIADDDIDECLALGYDYEIPSVAGLPVAGLVPQGGISKGQAIGVISHGEAFAIASGSVTKDDKLYATTTGALATVTGTEIACAVALEDASDGEKFKVVKFTRGA